MSLLSRLKGLRQIQRLEQDLDDELLSHVEMRAEENLAAGMSPGRSPLRRAAPLWQFDAAERRDCRI